jgi:hypothetical protein
MSACQQWTQEVKANTRLLHMLSAAMSWLFGSAPCKYRALYYRPALYGPHAIRHGLATHGVVVLCKLSEKRTGQQVGENSISRMSCH